MLILGIQGNSFPLDSLDLLPWSSLFCRGITFTREKKKFLHTLEIQALFFVQNVERPSIVLVWGRHDSHSGLPADGRLICWEALSGHIMSYGSGCLGSWTGSASSPCGPAGPTGTTHYFSAWGLFPLNSTGSQNTHLPISPLHNWYPTIHFTLYDCVNLF